MNRVIVSGRYSKTKTGDFCHVFSMFPAGVVPSIQRTDEHKGPTSEPDTTLIVPTRIILTCDPTGSRRCNHVPKYEVEVF